ncbi:MAG: hypothetical protein ABI889_02680 [Gemmatimonadota bacterium]
MATIVASVGALSVIFVAGRWGLAMAKRHTQLPPPYSDTRLEQLQQSVDAIAIEVERIAEAQRFSAKLLAGREAEPRLPR